MTLVAFIDNEHLEGVLVEFDERGATFMRSTFGEGLVEAPQPGPLKAMGGKLAMLPIFAA